MSFIFYMIFLHTLLANDKCLPGSAFCKNGTRNICGINGAWISIDCPDGKICTVSKGEITCTDKGSTNENEADDEELSNKKELNEDESEHEDRNFRSKHKKKAENDILPDINKLEKNDDKTKNKKSVAKTVAKSPEEIPIHEHNKKKKKTITITKTISNRASPSEIKLEYEKKNEKEEPQQRNPIINITQSEIKGAVSPPEKNQMNNNINDRKSSSIPESKNISTQPQNVNDKAHISGGGNAPTDKATNNQPANGGSSKSPISGSNSGSKPPSGGSDGKPSSSGTKPSSGSSNGSGGGRGGSKPTGGGSGGDKPQASGGSGGSKPTGGGSGGNKPQASGGSGGSKPTGGGSGGDKPQASGGSGGSKSTGGGTGSSAGGSSKSSQGSGSKTGGSGSSNKTASGGDKKSTTGNGKSTKGGNSKSASGGSKSSGGGSSSNGEGITTEDLKSALEACGYSPPEDIDVIAEAISSSIKDKNEIAMFLANIFHESGGLQYKEELACKDNPGSCAGQYDDKTGVPGKSYHGRGYMQLSWAANYKAAGEGLGLGDALVQDPDQVASDTKLAIDVSTWFWNEKVAKAPGVAEKKFGATIKAINGALECNGSNEEQSKKRWDNYTKIADAWNITDKASEEGCYN